jgi:hypothetical protein
MKKIKKLIIVFLAMLAVLAVGVSADEAYSSVIDPLISLSYANDVLGPQIMEQVLEKIESEYVKKGDLASSQTGSYSIVTLKKNQTLTAKGICEVILLEGSATVLVTSSENIQQGNGINDLTEGTVLVNGTLYPINHYTIITKADGRGFFVTSSTAVVLIRGDYNIT